MGVRRYAPEEDPWDTPSCSSSRRPVTSSWTAYDQSQDPAEWLDIHFVDWKSSGDTRFAPLASAYGDMECNGFWHHDPPKTDKDGVWVEANVAKAPRLKARAEEPGANIGRCRVIELQPNTYAETVTRNLHIDDNNRLNPEGTGWIVRGFFNLTDNPDSVMVLREVKDDPSTESRIPLAAGAQVIVDTQRLYHAVYHPGAEPRYCLITSWESGPELSVVHREAQRRLPHRQPARYRSTSSTRSPASSPSAPPRPTRPPPARRSCPRRSGALSHPCNRLLSGCFADSRDAEVPRPYVRR